ncbi:MAG TPA: RsmE family RNA methyltransferase [Candidatus Magasanikbacteria bacterium]|nr:RsmE family RNA methyltransferase [Candidatus Magasanikbacteria bacterium]
MKIHRFFLSNLVLDEKEKSIKLSDKEIVHQIVKVLKLKIGEQLALCDGKGKEIICVLEGIDKKELILKVVEYKEFSTEGRNIILYLAVLKRENFELAVQKAAEIGVNKLVPIITDRTIKTGINLERLNKISKEACELSGRGTLMEVVKMIKFKEAILEVKNNDVNLFFAPGGTEFSPGKTIDRNSKNVGLFIGPEGGWSTEELVLAKENNMKITGIGKNILRGETAGIVASFLAVNY